MLGAQDTGGALRSRRLIPIGKGTCTVIVRLTTGASGYSFAPKGFQSEKLVTVL
ncbi:MAG: hypothetical protein SFX73_12710 [Kofleriaceae bacterium]|nr:hypothetical protein [Kofleriaceae bacterium]